MDRTEFRKILFKNLKQYCIDNNELEAEAIVELVERYNKVSLLNNNALKEWQDLMDYIGIEVKF